MSIDPTTSPATMRLIEQELAALGEQEPILDLPKENPEVYELPDTSVDLPGGYYDTDTGQVSREAEVRELTGEDEEALARIKSPGKVLLAVLERGVVSIAGSKPDKQVFDELLAGDRDTLLLSIRKVTFGAEVTITMPCPSCGDETEYTIDLEKDIPIRRLEQPEDRMFTLQCKAGPVEVGLPDGRVQRDLLLNPDRTLSEVNTALLAGCVQSINGLPVMGPGPVRKLSIKDREKITIELAERNPGPRFTDVKGACSRCGSETSLPISLAALFRI